MFNKKNDENFLYDEPQDVDKKSPKKIIIDIIGIVLVIGFIIGTYFFIVNREKIMSTIPITKDENGNLIIKRKTDVKSRDLEQPKAADDLTVYNQPDGLFVKFDNFEEPFDKGYKFKVYISPSAYKRLAPTMTYKLIIDKVTVDGFDFSNRYEFEVTGEETITQEIFLEKSELNQYSIIRPNNIYLYIKTEGFKNNDTTSLPHQVTLRTIYNTPMDNSLKGTVLIGDISQLKIYYYKQVDDIEYTYLYFSAKNTSGRQIPTVRVKKLVINDKVYEYNDIDEDIYYLTEKLFYIRIPKKQVAKVDKFIVSFFVILNEDQKNEKIYVSPEFTHES